MVTGVGAFLEETHEVGGVVMRVENKAQLPCGVVYLDVRIKCELNLA
jgi:hypothetical protein